MSQSARVLFAGILLVLLGACSQAPGALDGGPLDDAAGRAEGPTADLALPGDAPMDGAANDLQGTTDAGDGAHSTDTIIDISTDIITDIATDSSSMDAEVAVTDGSGTDAGGRTPAARPWMRLGTLLETLLGRRTRRRRCPVRGPPCAWSSPPRGRR
jgi:hypothetical protein